jgi:hypothetical protein
MKEELRKLDFIDEDKVRTLVDYVTDSDGGLNRQLDAHIGNKHVHTTKANKDQIWKNKRHTTHAGIHWNKRKQDHLNSIDEKLQKSYKHRMNEDRHYNKQKEGVLNVMNQSILNHQNDNDRHFIDAKQKLGLGAEIESLRRDQRQHLSIDDGKHWRGDGQRQRVEETLNGLVMHQDNEDIHMTEQALKQSVYQGTKALINLHESKDELHFDTGSGYFNKTTWAQAVDDHMDADDKHFKDDQKQMTDRELSLNKQHRDNPFLHNAPPDPNSVLSGGSIQPQPPPQPPPSDQLVMLSGS